MTAHKILKHSIQLIFCWFC